MATSARKMVNGTVINGTVLNGTTARSVGTEFGKAACKAGGAPQATHETSLREDKLSPRVSAGAGRWIEEEPPVLLPLSRVLAEGALLGPLRDVGTVAGALRSGIGGSLREMAAARYAMRVFLFL